MLVISLAANNKLINGEEESEIIKNEVLHPQLIPLASKINLKENSLQENLSSRSQNGESPLSLNSVEDANKFQKAQAKLMSFKRKSYNSEATASRSEIAKNLNNALRINRIEMVQNEHPELPKMLSYYLDKKNRDELRRLSKAKLLPEGFKSYNKRLHEVPAFLQSKQQNHKRILGNLDSDKLDSKSSVRTLSASREDKRYFLSSDYFENRLNNSLRKNRLNLLKNEGESEMPVILANYLKRKVSNERNQLASKGIVVEDVDAADEAPETKPHKGKNRQSSEANGESTRIGKGKTKEKLINKIKQNQLKVQEVDDDVEVNDSSDDYEEVTTTTRKPPRRADSLVLIDDRKGNRPNQKGNFNNKQQRQQKLQRQQAAESESDEDLTAYDEVEEVPVNRGNKNRLQQQNRNNYANSNNNNNYNYRRNQKNQNANFNVNANRPYNQLRRPVQQSVEDEEYDLEETTTVRPRFNNRNNNNAKANRGYNNQRRNNFIQEQTVPEQEQQASENGGVNRNNRNKHSRRKDSSSSEVVESSTAVAPTTQAPVVEETTQAEEQSQNSGVNRKYRNKHFRRKDSYTSTSTSTAASEVVESSSSAPAEVESSSEPSVALTTAEPTTEAPAVEAESTQVETEVTTTQAPQEEVTAATSVQSQEEETVSTEPTQVVEETTTATTTAYDEGESTTAQSVNLQRKESKNRQSSNNPSSSPIKQERKRPPLRMRSTTTVASAYDTGSSDYYAPKSFPSFGAYAYGRQRFNNNKAPNQRLRNRFY